MATKKKGSKPAEVKVTIGHDLAGKRLQKSFYGKTKSEARKKAQDFLTRQEWRLRPEPSPSRKSIRLRDGPFAG